MYKEVHICIDTNDDEEESNASTFASYLVKAILEKHSGTTGSILIYQTDKDKKEDIAIATILKTKTIIHKLITKHPNNEIETHKEEIVNG